MLVPDSSSRLSTNMQGVDLPHAGHMVTKTKALTTDRGVDEVTEVVAVAQWLPVGNTEVVTQCFIGAIVSTSFFWTFELRNLEEFHV